MAPEAQAEWVTLADGLSGFVARPSAAPRGGVIVFQEIFGVNAHIRDVAQRVAAQGYLVIAPDIFHRTAPRFEVGYDSAGVTEGRKHKEACTLDGLFDDTKACMAWLEAQGVRDIGCVGFCFGGHVTFLAATLPGMKAAACFYGGGISTTRPGGGPPSLELAPKLRANLRLFYGQNDAMIPEAQVEAIAHKLASVGAKFEIIVYHDAGHGFACDQRPDYRADKADDAWRHTFALFAEHLRG